MITLGFLVIMNGILLTHYIFPLALIWGFVGGAILGDNIGMVEK